MPLKNAGTIHWSLLVFLLSFPFNRFVSYVIDEDSTAGHIRQLISTDLAQAHAQAAKSHLYVVKGGQKRVLQDHEVLLTAEVQLTIVEC